MSPKKVFWAVSLMAAFQSPAYCIDYKNTGMTCEEIGRFAQIVVISKKDGLSLKEQLKGMHESLSGGNFKTTEKVLAKVIQEIYKKPYLAQLTPEMTREVFINDCKSK